MVIKVIWLLLMCINCALVGLIDSIAMSKELFSRINKVIIDLPP